MPAFILEPGSILRPGYSPPVVALPPGDRPHVPGGLDPVASCAEHLEVPHIPLVPTHGDRQDVIKNKGMMRMPVFRSAGYRNFLPAPGTPAFLLEEDKTVHLANRGMLFAPV
jgi:hypothetical protein